MSSSQINAVRPQLTIQLIPIQCTAIHARFSGANSPATKPSKPRSSIPPSCTVASTMPMTAPQRQDDDEAVRKTHNPQAVSATKTRIVETLPPRSVDNSGPGYCRRKSRQPRDKRPRSLGPGGAGLWYLRRART